MFKYALIQIFRRKVRTLLTSVGITIAIILLGFIIFGMSGLQKLFVDQFNSQFQPNQLIVSRYGLDTFRAITGDTEKEDEKKKVVFTDKEINEIKADPRVEKVEAMLLVSGMELKLKGQDEAYQQSFISGWDTDKNNPYFTKVYSESDKPGKKEIFVSNKFAEFYNLEPEKIIGKKVILQSSLNSLFTAKTKSVFNKEFEFKITGVFDPGQDKNDAWLSPQEALRILVDLGGFDSKGEYLKKIGYDQIMITVKLNDLNDYKEYFKDKYGYKPLSSDEILSFLDNITNGLTIALILFGLVSAIVASIGIINTMIMSIYEQTREIGIIKAIGASDFQVLIIFLIQSAIIGLLGGILGLSILYISMRIGDPYIVEQLKTAGFSATQFFKFDLNTAFVIAICSLVVGVLSGIYPAIRASKLDPVKALRYE